MRNRARFIFLLFILLLLVSGCSVYQPSWLRGITAPRWQVPFSVPVIQPIRIDLSGLQSVTVPGDGITIDLGMAAELVLTEETRAILAHPGIVGLALTLDMSNHAPIGFDLELHFFSAEAAASDPVVIGVALPSGKTDASGRTVAPVHESMRIEMNPALRELLTNERVYVAPRLRLYNQQASPGDFAPRFSEGDYIMIRGYATVTVGINY